LERPLCICSSSLRSLHPNPRFAFAFNSLDEETKNQIDSFFKFESILSRLARAPGLLTVKTESGESPLYMAVATGVEKAVICLLDAKANPNATHTQSGETPLHAAIRAAAADPKKTRILTLLLNNGAKPFLADTQGVTPHDLAVKLNASAVVDILEGDSF